MWTILGLPLRGQDVQDNGDDNEAVIKSESLRGQA